MKPIASHQIACTSQPLFSSQTKGWEHIFVEEFHHPAGEGKMLYPDEYVICLSLEPRPVRLLQIQGDQSYHSFVYFANTVASGLGNSAIALVWNVLTQPMLRDRILEMRRVLTQHQLDLGYITLCAVK